VRNCCWSKLGGRESFNTYTYTETCKKHRFNANLAVSVPGTYTETCKKHRFNANTNGEGCCTREFQYMYRDLLKTSFQCHFLSGQRRYQYTRLVAVPLAQQRQTYHCTRTLIISPVSQQQHNQYKSLSALVSSLRRATSSRSPLFSSAYVCTARKPAKNLQAMDDAHM